MPRLRFASTRRMLLIIICVLVGALLPPQSSRAAGSNLSNPKNNPVFANPSLYVVFWGSQWNNSSNYQAMNYLEDFLTNLSGGNWLGTLSQYGAGNTTGVLKGSWVDTTDALPASPSRSGIDTMGQEAQAALQHFGISLPASSSTVQLSDIVLIALPPGNDDAEFPATDCAYHDAYQFTAGSSTYLVPFISLSYQPDAPGGCFENSVNFPAPAKPGTSDTYGHGLLDGESWVASHEYAETITDPFYNYGLGSLQAYNPPQCFGTFNNCTNQCSPGSCYCPTDGCSEVADQCNLPSSNVTNLASGTQQYWTVTPLWSDTANGGSGACVVGAAPKAAWATSPINFGSQPIGISTGAVFPTLNNVGDADLHIGFHADRTPYPVDMSITGANATDFQVIEDTCIFQTLPPLPPAPFGECGAQIVFTPTGFGPRSATLWVFSDDANSPLTLPLSGYGTISLSGFVSGPVKLADTACVPCEAVIAGGVVTGSSIGVSFTNADSVPRSIQSVGLTGRATDDFGSSTDVDNGCTIGRLLQPNQSCTVEVTFLPQKTGLRQALLQVADGSAGSPFSVPVSGTGLGPTLSFSIGPNLTPTRTLSWSNVVFNRGSASQTLHLSNTGQTPLAIQSISATDAAGNSGGDSDFSYSSANCPGAVLNPGASCDISVTFTPRRAAAESGTLTISDNASDSPQVVGLSGTAISPFASFSPSSFTSFAAYLGTTSTAQHVQLRNLGTAPLHISSITTSGPFVLNPAPATTCPIGTALSQPCTISVSYRPTLCGNQTGSLFVNDDAQGGFQSLPLHGYGVCRLPLGSFVIGDENATVGSAVTFWGSEWSNANQFSGGPAPGAFKGYADTLATNPPACGQPWSADTGASGSPPDSLPPVIGVIVAKHITRSGASIGGKSIAQIVAVQPDPGYAPDPAHPGMGTVLGVVC